MSDPLVTRAAVDVRAAFDARTIELVVCPYNVPATVSDDGRTSYREEIAPGCFADSLAKRGDRVKLHLRHEPESAIGRSLRWTNSSDRLVGVWQVARTRDGDDALELAAMGLVGGSVGFRPVSSSWSADRSSVVRTRAELDHVALTAVPAYDDAAVLAVRSAAHVPSPEVAQLRAWLASARDTLTT